MNCIDTPNYPGAVREITKEEYSKLKAGHATLAQPPVRRKEIRQTLDNLHDAISKYDNLVGVLRAALEPVLACSSPACEEAETAQGYQTDMANEINSAESRIYALNRILESIIERIEL